jgi:poly(A) polymerase
VMLAAEPLVGRHPRAEIYQLGTRLFVDRVLLNAPDNWRALLKLAQDWTPPELPVGGADVLKLGLAPGPRVGQLISAVERWWIAGDFSADRSACLAELERLAKSA